MIGPHSPTCARCDEPRWRAELCKHHYHTWRFNGYTRTATPAAATARVQQLLDNGWLMKDLEARSGLSRRSLLNIKDGRYAYTRRHTTAKLAAVPDYPPRTKSLIVGTRRRVRALIAAGWTLTEQAKILGWSRDALANVIKEQRNRNYIASETHDQVCRLYDKLSSTPAPPGRNATFARTWARKQGFAPPHAWWDDELDNPSAKPAGLRRACVTEGCDREARSFQAKYCNTCDYKSRIKQYPICKADRCRRRARTLVGGVCGKHEVEGEE